MRYLTFIKNPLPQVVHFKLLDDPTYHEAKTTKSLKSDAKHFHMDKLVATNSSNGQSQNEVASIFKEIVAIRKELENAKSELSSSRKDQEHTHQVFMAMSRSSCRESSRLIPSNSPKTSRYVDGLG